ncbi:hypothetical protein HN51_009842 [Arachis hypogaea]|nr:putative phospholipid:diacylglycerol acyltransferase 2 isoform X1 [Arachis hypogaea]QHO54815.1 Putative phospholipid:diacylglycerol acyltransferase [Arachis hypogaea]QHO54816.1 Putative phospholipid:diacylglycerol acyltransferase [Arachis hypogaea]
MSVFGWLVIYLCLHNLVAFMFCGCTRWFSWTRITSRSEGVTALHPVLLLPGIFNGGLELWEGRPCAQPLFRNPLWPPTFAQFFKRPLCYLEHLSLHNETGMDPPGIRVRAVPGLVAADNFAPAYSFWSLLIQIWQKLDMKGRTCT